MSGAERLIGKRNCLPDRMVIGPQKAGTTWLHEYFAAHPDVGTPRWVKETFFFDRNYHRGLRWYARHFVVAGQQHTVEVAPTYFHHPSAPERVRTVLGTIPLICTLRDPAKRAFSLYLHLRRRGTARCDFRQAVARFPVILESSRYATCLRRWFAQFGRRRVCVLFLEQLAADQEGFVRKVCEHFELEYFPPPEALGKRVNQAALPPSATLARIGYRTAELFRRVGWYGVVELAKALGLKALFFGTPGRRQVPSLSAADRQWFLELVAEEIEQLPALLEQPVPDWLGRQPQGRRAA